MAEAEEGDDRSENVIYFITLKFSRANVIVDLAFGFSGVILDALFFYYYCVSSRNAVFL